MENLSEQEKLLEAIATLKSRQAEELELLKDQIDINFNSLKPINIIKNTLHEVATSPSIKNNLLYNAIGLTTGYLSKILFVGATSNPIKNIIGTVLQFAVTNLIAKNTDKLLTSSLTNPKNISSNGVED